ncbi:Probable dienelactone hydrolase [Mycobacteroides abscessus subsp. abscessus]|nr:Probable dienelactone hydrolase [Mycobacteroides abscessus subsp. abscessus]
MLFEPRLRAGIHDGSISVAYRRWKRPQVRVGGRYRVGSDRIRSMTEFDFIEVDAVDEILARDIDDADAQLAGYPSAAAARSDVGAQDAADVLYRLAFRKIDMPDPRVASFHGGNLAKADDLNSPHHLAGRITGVVLIAAAEEDASFPAEQEQLLGQVLTDAGVRHTIETYPAKHGFAVTDNPTYDEGAAQRHWKALEDLYGATLGH